MHPQRVNIRLQGLDRCALTMGAISGPLSQLGALLWRQFTSHEFTWLAKKHSGKADQSTLASGGSEHAWLFIVAISWGNNINFSLYVKMLSFCSDSHIYTIATREHKHKNV